MTSKLSYRRHRGETTASSTPPPARLVCATVRAIWPYQPKRFEEEADDLHKMRYPTGPLS